MQWKFWKVKQNGLKLKNVKIELGNQATDWTPAPEDSLRPTLQSSGTTLTLSGGKLDLAGGEVRIPTYSQNLTEVGPGYIILDTTLSTIVPKFVKMVAVASTPSYISWRDFNTGTEIAVSYNPNFIVIATFHVEVWFELMLQRLINPVLTQHLTKSHFMDLLNDRQTVTSGNFGLWADAMGVTDVFASHCCI